MTEETNMRGADTRPAKRSTRKPPLPVWGYFSLMLAIVGLATSSPLVTWGGVILTVLSLGVWLSILYLGATATGIAVVLGYIVAVFVCLYLVLMPLSILGSPLDAPVLGHSILIDKNSTCSTPTSSGAITGPFRPLQPNLFPNRSFQSTLNLPTLKTPDKSAVSWLASDIPKNGLSIPNIGHDRIVHCRSLAGARTGVAVVWALVGAVLYSTFSRKH